MERGRQWLAAVDEANLVLDHVGQVNVFLVAGLLAPCGFIASDGTPDMDELRAVLTARIAALPELCRRIATQGRRHHWVRTTPDLEHHVRLAEPVDGAAGLEQMCADLMIRPLRLDRPLWEILIVPGAATAETGIVLRIHHALADGMAAVAIVQGLFDPGDHRETSAVRPDDRAPAEASHRGLRRSLRRFGVGLHRIRKTLQGRDVGDTVLLGERSPHRGVVFANTDIAALATAVRTRGATVNDALLAATASGFRAALAHAGERIPARLPVSVPVALQRHGTARNQVGVMLAQLPLDVPDPDERLRLIAPQTREEKLRAREQRTLEFMRGPIGARIMDRVARRQHLVAGFITDVPGPAGTLYLAGAPVTALWPVAVLAGNVRLGVAALSYAGRLGCGIHFDAMHVPGAVFARAMGEELARLAS